MEDNSEDTILNKRQVAAITGISTATIDRLRARGEFADSIQLSPRRKAWKYSAIRRWLSERPSAR